MDFKFFDIYGIKILKATRNDIISLISESIQTKKTINIGYINANVFLKCLKNEELSSQINKFLLIPDGIGMYLASKFLFGKNGFKERIVTTDLWYNLLKIADKKRHKIFFLGGSVEAGSMLEKKICLIEMSFDAHSLIGITPSTTISPNFVRLERFRLTTSRCW